MYTILPLTEDPWQTFNLDLNIDEETFHAKVDIRYLPAPDLWILSIWDNSTGDLLVNQIPLICSYVDLNDLLWPFRHKRGGKGVGSLFVLRNVEEPRTPDPAEKTLLDFQVLWGQTADDRQ